jgi:crotonobetainyl-CoA:carnitine CoA-transferase CaiB-like acyl-CoA transferase
MDAGGRALPGASAERQREGNLKCRPSPLTPLPQPGEENRFHFAGCSCEIDIKWSPTISTEVIVSALSGIKILELAESVAGEYCCKLLADFGADVIKIEKPGQGSPTRRLGPFAASDKATGSANSSDHERSGLFAYLNTNKSSIELDLSTPEAAAALAKVLDAVDVVIDDHPVAWLQSIGLDPEIVQQHWPSLIVCSITPYGLATPAERTHAEDLNVFHSSGWGYHTPSAADESLPPLKGAGRFMVSYEAGVEAALCIAAALFERGSTQQGRVIELSKQAVLASRVDYVLGQMLAGDMDVSQQRAALDLGGPASILPCKDGYVYIWLSAPAHWEGLRKLLGNPQWMNEFPERWMERACTPERVANCRQHLAEWLKTQHKDEVSADAQKLGVTLVAVNNAKDLFASPQYSHRKFFADVVHPVLGKAAYPTVPYKLSATPATITAPAPLLGQHTTKLDTLLDDPSHQSKKPAATKSLTKTRTRGGPLQGIRVVELTKVWAGPYVGKLLAYLGAEVIRIESEGSLDVTRTFGVQDINNAPGFQAVNPQKLSVQIDMKSEEGNQLILDLLAKSDIVIENLRPGAIDRLGLGYARVKTAKRDIVYVSMGMYGNDGPLAYQTGYAPCFAALGGLSSLVGYEGQAPLGMNIRYADSTFGCFATYAALIALVHRQRSGVGQFIDVSAVETMTTMIGDTIMDFTLNGVLHECDGNRHADMAPHGVYPCRADEWISIAVASDDVWRALANVMNHLADDSRFSSLAARKHNEVELDQLVAAWTANHDARELTAELQKRGIAAAKSESSVDLVADSQLWSSGFFHEVTDRSTQQSRTVVGQPWQMSRGATLTDAAPRLGEDNAYIFGEVLGLSAAEQQRLHEAGVTR